MPGPHLVYFADPMCSWCWGFSPVIAAIRERFGKSLPIRLVLGGLRPGTTTAMDDAARAAARSHWEHVREASGQPFDFAFFSRETFVYDTEPACRAVVVMRRRGMDEGLAGLRRIHAAFYAENRNVTAAGTLTEIAVELGFDATAFRAEFDAEAAVAETSRGLRAHAKRGYRRLPDPDRRQRWGQPIRAGYPRLSGGRSRHSRAGAMARRAGFGMICMTVARRPRLFSGPLRSVAEPGMRCRRTR